jgi:hypothetical protein
MAVHTPTTHQPTRQAIAVHDRSAKLRVTGKLKRALDYLVFTGSKADLQAAAQHAGMTTYSLRCALNKPHVKAYYQTQLDVLRSGESARNIHRLIEIRDAADNMPAVQAIRALERDTEQGIGTTTQRQSAGITIVIETGRAVGVAVGADAPMLDLQATSTDGGG